MPATEQTWRDSKLLHLIFGLSGLAMLGTTIWMLAADHRREWKEYVRKFQSIEAWTAEARLNQLESDKYHKEVKEADQEWEATRRVIPDEKLLKEFKEEVNDDAEKREVGRNSNELDAALRELNAAYTALDASAQDKGPAQDKPPAARDNRPAERDRLWRAMQSIVNRARFREEYLASEKKFRAAELDVARSQYELAVGNELPPDQLDSLQATVTRCMEKVDKANLAVQDAKTHRLKLESLLGAMTAQEADAKKKLDELVDKRIQLEKVLYERKNKVMNEFVSLPIFDAFGGTKVDQIWLPKLTIYNNFSDVARFDRCTNCHLAMDKTAPGSSVKPLYEQQHGLSLAMATPAEAPPALQKKTADPADAVATETLYNDQLKEIYGLQLADKGLFDANEAMVSVVRAETPAAKARLEVGDVIEAVGDVKILGKRMIYNSLLESVPWGQPLKLRVRRGLPNPFASHPRLDLFVGSLSPHKMAEVGCTICHDGQGSATAFKWASHSPNDPAQGSAWRRDYGWFDNHHWVFSMYPKRFAESLCLKCHHDVTELAASERFPDPPAPKLTEGFHLIEQYGCYGCHEINGFDGPNKRIGPDLRTEPNYAAAAEALLAGEGLSDAQRDWASELVREPSNDAARHALSESLKSAATLPGQPDVTKRLVNLLDDVETPGRLRKVGPSLRHVKSKLDFDFLYSWVRKPSDFRPTTKMPQFFGQAAHLDGKGLHDSKRFEPMEIRGVAEFLLANSQPFKFTEPPKSVSVEPSAERGMLAFRVRCLACHQHSDFPDGKMEQGPDLSRMGAKLGGKDKPDGKKWLYTWLRNPSKYHARTLMPNMILDPLAGLDGKKTDPAADIAEFLLGSGTDWHPKDVPSRQLTDKEQKALQDLALENLKNVFTRTQSEKYLEQGIPEDRRSELKGDEVELLGKMTVDKKLRYVGRRAISKYGCSGCHDIPGFEDAKPIGTGLADWARKSPDRLAFEQIVEYMKHGHGKPGALVPEVGPPPADVSDKTIEEADVGAYGDTHIDVLNIEDPTTAFFVNKLDEHQREGFIWQKLREPRSYDYKKTQNKSYNERLRMPKFTVLDDQKREAIITFVLGLVSEPPASQYVYQPTPRRKAIAEGLQVIEKFNCTGCHALAMDRWQLGYETGDFPDPDKVDDYAFLKVHFTPQQIKASDEIDSRGLKHTTIVGMPTTDEEGRPLRRDEEGSPVDPEEKQAQDFYSFVLWDNALVNGKPRPAGLQNLLVPESRIEKRYAAVGGFLARLAFKWVVAEEKKLNPQVKADEAWGWLPPPLVGEGRKVQPAWLHDFLLDPHMIRPSTVLRMPKFNMSPADATRLVNYFAAVDGVDYPYDFDPRTRESHLEALDAEHPDRLDDALKIVIDNNFCVKCHLLGDFNPGGSERAKGPQLDRLYKRLRPGFTMTWIAKPTRLLPYTSMPVNIPYDKGVSQALYKGDSLQQLNAVVDLLLNYDRFAEGKTPIAPLIKPTPPAAASLPAADDQAGGNRTAGAQSKDAAQ